MAAKKQAGSEDETGWRRFFRKAGDYWATAAEVLARANKIALKVDVVLRECRKIAEDVKKFKARWADGFGPSTA
ncbi:hypothetical protein [Kitasatospora sp. MBT66]|uniref:hypothetical protein n=1 Tax=Kitasatospora sp. MBT66 TaxID=1444769 RepID=UPI0006EBE0AF|nr:hypothetical protein [Kitasatospora sp. MBT66]